MFLKICWFVVWNIVPSEFRLALKWLFVIEPVMFITSTSRCYLNVLSKRARATIVSRKAITLLETSIDVCSADNVTMPNAHIRKAMTVVFKEKKLPQNETFIKTHFSLQRDSSHAYFSTDDSCQQRLWRFYICHCLYRFDKFILTPPISRASWPLLSRTPMLHCYYVRYVFIKVARILATLVYCGI